MFSYQVLLPLGPIKLITLYQSVTRYFPWICLHYLHIHQHPCCLT